MGTQDATGTAGPATSEAAAGAATAPGNGRAGGQSGDGPPRSYEAMSSALAGLNEMKHKAEELLAEIAEGVSGPCPFERYSRNPNWPGLPLENLPKRVAGLPPKEMMPPRKVAAMFERVMEYVYSQWDLIRRMKETPDHYRAFGGQWIDVDRYIARFWEDDTEFCRQLIQGLHPLIIQTVNDIDQIPGDMKSLEAQGKSVADLIAERRLFMCDYSILDGVEPYAGMYCYAPIVLVYKELLDTGGSRLNLLGIQLTRKAEGNEVYRPGSDTPNKYLFAKIHAACADVQVHQFISHLGLGHLGMEPFTIAHRNAFPEHHVIGRLLAPHFSQTLGINYLARRTLISDTMPFTDRIFSAGVKQALAAVLKAWGAYDFAKQSFPALLEARGFDEARSDGLKDYFYRDDGFLVWNAIEEYVRDVVVSTYPTDELVAADPVLRAWAKESTDSEKGDIPGFPAAFTDKEHLVQTLATIIFHASVQHSILNYPQLRFQSYVPNRPPALFKPMPEAEGDIDREYIQSSLPPDGIVHFQLLFSYVLTLPSDTPLTSIDVMKLDCSDAHHRFHERLEAIGQTIRNRNAALVAEGKPPYEYLIPDNIASSVEI